MARGDLTKVCSCVMLASAQAHLPGLCPRTGPILPEGSGDKESPEDLRAREVYASRMWLFHQFLESGPKARRRNTFSDFTTKNSEEAWGNR